MDDAARRHRLLFDKAPIALYELDLRALYAWLGARGLIAAPDRIRELPETDLADALRCVTIVDLNDAALRASNSSRDEILREGVNLVNSSALGPLVEQLGRGAGELEIENELEIGGQKRRFVLRAELPANPAQLDCIVVSLLDVEDSRRAAERLHDTQRLEAIALLAGSVAHDFNNLLTIVRMSADRIAKRVPAAEGRELERLRDATTRASVLTRQLLLFSRRDVAHRQVFVPDRAIADLEPVLRRELDPSIDLVIELGSDHAAIDMDPAQLEQVIRNLVINAADAMPTGGTLRVTRGRRGDMPEMVAIAVSDTGGGIPDAVRARVYEPFFTTRPGKRAGLGLSIVHGIATQAGGEVLIETGAHGTRVEVSLPASAAAMTPIPAETTGTERVLLVEDEEGVRDVARVTLEEAGYDVVAVPDGAAALRAFGEGERVDIVVSDLVMPGIGGRDLVDRLRVGRPALPVLYVSGYAGEQPLVLDGDARSGFLAKPFTAEQLLRSIRSVLEAA